MRRILTIAPGTRRHVSRWLLAPVLLAAVVLLSPPPLADPDTLSHLAAGRWIVETGTVPQVDPFTFPRPTARWHNPEWLADVLWFRVHRLGGEAALQAIKLAVICLGLLLTVCWAGRLGAPPALTLLLLLALLPPAAARFTVRNDIFAFLLVPLYGLLVEEAHERPLAWAALLPVGWLWANLHASFVLGWLVIAASLLQRVAARQPVAWRWALPTLALHLSLPLLGPQGAGVYVQLWDHAVGASTYREAITEWKSPLLSRAHLALLPLHLCALAGVVSLLRPTARARVGLMLLAAAGLGLAYVSRRFLPFAAIVAVPGLAALVADWARSWRAPARIWTGAALGILVLAYLAFAVRVSLRNPPVDVLHDAHGPLGAATFVARRAPDGARVFNTFNTGPWLLWLAAPRVTHYVDPRNHLGAGFVAHYLELMRDPERLARELDSRAVSLALLTLADADHDLLLGYLDARSDWQVVYLDGHAVVYARVTERNRQLLERFGARKVANAVGAADLDRLRGGE